VTVDVWGTSVPDVWVVLDVVLAEALVDVVLGEVVEVVEDELEVGLLEQAASAKAQAGRSNRLIDRFRKAEGTLQLTTTATGNGGSARSVVRPEGDDARIQTRAGAVPITEARSIERRWGQ
jgi:hypothetical protein